MEQYYKLFEDLITITSFQVCYINTYFEFQSIRIDLSGYVRTRTSYSWKTIFGDQINCRKLTLLELRELLYKMAMFSSDTSDGSTNRIYLDYSLTKIKLLIDKIETDFSVGKRENANNINYSELLKKYSDLELKYKLSAM